MGVNVHRVVYDDFFPEMAAIFYEIQVQAMLLVSGLCSEVIKKHDFRYLPGGVDNIPFFGTGQDADI